MTEPTGEPAGSRRFHFDTVRMETATPGGWRSVDGLVLEVDDHGLTLQVPGGTRPLRASWSEVTGLWLEPPDLRGGTVPLVGIVGGWARRWYLRLPELPPARAADLDLAIDTLWRPRFAAPVARVVPAPPRPAVLSPALPPPAPPPPGERRPRRLRLLVSIVGLLVVVALALVLGIMLGRGHGSAPVRPGPSSADRAARAATAKLNLTLSDLPAGWSVDPSTDGPLRSFLQVGAGPKPTPQEARQAKRTSTQFEHCMGISASHDRVFGTTGPAPRAVVSSPAFAGAGAIGGSVLEAGSQSSTYRSSAPVAGDSAFTARPEFAGCFAQALGLLLADGLRQQTAGTETTVGTPVLQTMSLPQAPGVTAVGVTVSIPLSSPQASTEFQVGTVFLGGGRGESTLFLYGTPSAIPASLASSLTATLEHNLQELEQTSG